jgi:cytochrome c-type biogenesis protein CcmH/NrfG
VAPTDPPPNQADESRVRYGYRVIVAGFVLVALVAAVSLFKWTVVGAFFGVQVGAQGKAEAEAARDDAQKKAEAALQTLRPDQSDQFRKIYHEQR